MWARSGRARLKVDSAGGGDGVDVLLIHAGVTDRRGWRHVVDRLQGEHRCVSYDARGYGETTYEAEDGWSPVADAVAVLDAVGCDRACVVAASMGGRVAIDLALAHPERVAGLVLIGSGVGGAPSDVEGPAAETVIDAIDRAEAVGDLEAVNRLQARLWLDGAEVAEGRVGGAARELFQEMNGQALRAADPGPEADCAPAWPRLGEILVPTTVMVGDLDLRRLRGVGRALAARVAQAQFVALSGVAHLPHLEGDAATIERIAHAAARLG